MVKDEWINDDAIYALVALRGTATLYDIAADTGHVHDPMKKRLLTRMLVMAKQGRLAKGAPWCGVMTFEVVA